MFCKANPSNIVHEAETGMFEAHVTVESDKGVTCHVVHVPGAISIPFDVLRPQLVGIAIRQHNAGIFETRLTRVETDTDAAYRKLFAGPSLLDRLLGHAA